MVDLSEYPVLTGPSEDQLAKRQIIDYRSEREECLEWLLNVGKNPRKREGYAPGTVKARSYRMDRFYRFVWEEEGSYTVRLGHDRAL